jgi:hypothetical protein
MAVKSAREGEDLDEVRSELRRLGYLDHGFERFLLQDALRPRQPLRTLLLLTVKVGVLAGFGLALVLAFGLVAANSVGPASALEISLDTAVLFLHLFPPISSVAALAFLALCGVVLLVLRIYPVRHIETLSLAAAGVAGAAGLAGALRLAGGWLAESRPSQLALLAIGAPLAIYVLVKLTYHGLLTLAIRFTESAPRERLFSRRWLGFALLSALFVLMVPAVLSARRGTPASPGALPMAPGDRVLLLGIDGVLPAELDYLLARGDLPTLGRLAREGGVRRYTRQDEPPASFWTTVATGRPTPEHGVAALDSFQLRGVHTPLVRSGPLRAYWNRVEVPLRLAGYRPVLANRRRAYAVWELASRGGAPVLAVNWWATFPAEPVPGLVIAHGAYQLLAENAEGTVAPASALPAVRELARRSGAGPGSDPILRAALPPRSAAAVLEKAVAPDRFYREVFAGQLPAAPRAAALYLPALDIAAAGWQGGDVAFADLVRSELLEADRLLGKALDGFGTVAVVLDPGRRRSGGSGREGRILIWRRAGCGAAGNPRKIRPEIPAAAVASSLLRALGLPQSGELPEPPAGCAWPAPPVTVPSYGEPNRPAPPLSEGGEYLKNLRSLGYL